MKTWMTNYTDPINGITLEVLLNRLDNEGQVIFSVLFVGDSLEDAMRGIREYCIVSYVEEK